MSLIKNMDFKYDEENNFYDIRDSNGIRNCILNYLPYFVRNRISHNIKKEINIRSNIHEYEVMI